MQKKFVPADWLSAVHNADVAKMKEMIAVRYFPTMADSNETVLHWVATGDDRHIEIMRMLIDAGLDVNAKRLSGETPLLSAADRGVASLCQLLIEAGADVKCVAHGRSTVLHAAAHARKADVCRTLIAAGADASAVDAFGRAPLSKAIEASRSGSEPVIVDVCRALIEAGADPSFVPDGAKETYLTPFQNAVSLRKMDLVRLFIEECGEDPKQRTRDGQTMTQLLGRMPAAEKAEWKQFWNAMKTERSVRMAIQKERSMVSPPASNRSAAGMSPL